MGNSKSKDNADMDRAIAALVESINEVNMKLVSLLQTHGGGSASSMTTTGDRKCEGSAPTENDTLTMDDEVEQNINEKIEKMIDAFKKLFSQATQQYNSYAKAYVAKAGSEPHEHPEEFIKTLLKASKEFLVARRMAFKRLKLTGQNKKLSPPIQTIFLLSKALLNDKTRPALKGMVSQAVHSYVLGESKLLSSATGLDEVAAQCAQLVQMLQARQERGHITSIDDECLAKG